MKIEYPAKITKEEGVFLVQFNDLEEAFTVGETLEEALFNASEVLTLCLEHRIAKKHEIPNPSHEKEGKKGVHMIVPETGVGGLKQEFF
jgi:antitoxin HicB